MLCHTSLFIFSLCPHVTFYKTLTSLSTVVIKGHVGFLQLLKWPRRTSFFGHVEPSNCMYVELTIGKSDQQKVNLFNNHSPLVKASHIATHDGSSPSSSEPTQIDVAYIINATHKSINLLFIRNML